MSTYANVLNIPIHKNLSLKNLPNEIWKPIKGFEKSYMVSSIGRVKSLYREILRGGVKCKVKLKILKQQKTKSGYLIVGLNKNGIKTIKGVHVLVADAFIPLNKNNLQVNHLDEVKTNNNKYNLQWCTCSENQNHGSINIRRGNSHKGKPKKYLRKEINQFTLDGKFVKRWEMLSSINKELGFHISNITLCCKGVSKQSNGFIWKYV